MKNSLVVMNLGAAVVNLGMYLVYQNPINLLCVGISTGFAVWVGSQNV